ncbi:protein of unknown function [Candidatus Filomicrobium marinum]|uniref:Uncharacterized protein n=1 Tax=Candidatus Filomicrobium marinum TaxID=1608628 RepID=A0A0D6JJL4_9HYPH|nr:protein of unknown function [Candidatus Filomicrobium marinum]CPR22153.1 protein of unknown function [Candidatus Filomicrobium marinum]
MPRYRFGPSAVKQSSNIVFPRGAPVQERVFLIFMVDFLRISSGAKTNQESPLSHFSI